MTKYKGTFTLLGISLVLQVLCTLYPPLTEMLCFQLGLMAPITVFTHMVAHGGWMHLIGNYSFGLPAMMYVEGKLGKTKFLDLFFFCGLVGALLNALVMGNEPMIGSSGAISGIFAAACCLFGHTKVEHLTALGVLGAFFLGQVLAWPTSSFTGIAVLAHVGGAFAGMVLVHRLYAPEHKCKPVKKR